MFWPKKYEIWSEMGPYGSVGAHIKTGTRYMAQEHFKTPPDPKKGHRMSKNPQTKKKSRVGQVLRPGTFTTLRCVLKEHALVLPSFMTGTYCFCRAMLPAPSKNVLISSPMVDGTKGCLLAHEETRGKHHH